MSPKHSLCLRAGVVALMFVSSSNGWTEDSVVDSYADDIVSLLEERFADAKSGMVIGLVDEHSRRVFSAGKLDNGSDEQIDGNTIFPLGSVTKVFTSLLLLDAVHRGEMRLDDPVSEYLPEKVSIPRYDGKEISLFHLGAQNSGLPHHFQDLDKLTDPKTGKLDLHKFKAASEATTIEDLYADVSKYRLSQAPGERFQYSNPGLALLGRAIERQTGQSFESLVIERICRPLEMRHTAISLDSERLARRVQGHLEDGSRVGHWNFQAMNPAGGLFSTANDMLTFLAAELGLIDSHLTPLMQESQIIRHLESDMGKTAMPWYDSGVYNPPATQLLGHSGHGFGGLAFIAIDTKQRRGVVILTNQLKIHPNPIGWTILQEMPFSPQNLAYAVRETVGIGIWLQADSKTDLARIINVFPTSPAGKAGLKSGLLIRRVNNVSVAGKSAQECIELMAGPTGTKVHLELFDPQIDKASSIDLIKQKFLTVTGSKSAGEG